MAELPTEVFLVKQFGEQPKVYYSRRSQTRIYPTRAGAASFAKGEFQVFRLRPGGQWEDITHEF